MRWILSAAICLLAVASTSAGNGYQKGKLYVYQTQIRLVAGNPDLKNQYAVQQLQANVNLYVQSQDSFLIQMDDIRLSSIVDVIESDDWRTVKLPGAQPLVGPAQQKLSQPIICEYDANGQFKRIEMAVDTDEYIKNIHRATCDRFQIQIKVEQPYGKKTGNLLKHESEDRFYNVTEDTLQGRCPSEYQVTCMPLYLAQNEHDTLPLHGKVCKNGPYFEVIRAKNYSACDNSPNYHIAGAVLQQTLPGGNYYGHTYQRSGVTKYTGCGPEDKFLPLQILVDEELHSNLEADSEKAVAGSVTNMTLVQLTDSQHPPPVPSPTLTQYTLRFRWAESGFNGVRGGGGGGGGRRGANYEGDDDVYLPRPNLQEPPMTPLRFVIMALDSQEKPPTPEQVVNAASKYILDAAWQAKDSGQFLDKDTNDNVQQAVQLVRLMDQNQVNQLKDIIFSAGIRDRKGQQGNKSARMLLVDVYSVAGTNPTIIKLQQMIANGELKQEGGQWGEWAAQTLMQIYGHVITPIDELLEKSLEFTQKMMQVDSVHISTTAMLNFADLLFKVVVDESLSQYLYPEGIYGPFGEDDRVVKQFLKILEGRLQQALHQDEHADIMAYVQTLGKLGHPDILPILTPIIHGESTDDIHIRKQAVYATYRLSYKTAADETKNVLSEVILNDGENPDVRSAALGMLPFSDLTVTTYQALATTSYFHLNRKVHCLLYSFIQDLIQSPAAYKGKFKTKAMAIMSFIKPITCGLHDSGVYSLADFEGDVDYGYYYGMMVQGSRDSILPATVVLHERAYSSGMAHVPNALVASFHSVRGIAGTLGHVFKYAESSEEYGDVGKAILEIRKQLSIEERPEGPAEGFLSLRKNRNKNRFYPFAGDWAEELKEYVTPIVKQFLSKEGYSYDWLRMWEGREEDTCVPSETGFLIRYGFNSPALLKLEGDIRATSYPDIINYDKKFLTVPQKLNATGPVQAAYTTQSLAGVAFLSPLQKIQITHYVERELLLNLEGQIDLSLSRENHSVIVIYTPTDKYSANLTFLQVKQEPYVATDKLVDLSITKDEKQMILINDPPSEDEMKMGNALGFDGSATLKLDTETQSPYEQYDALRQVARSVASGDAGPYDSQRYGQFRLSVDVKNSKAKSLAVAIAYEEARKPGCKHLSGQSSSSEELISESFEGSGSHEDDEDKDCKATAAPFKGIADFMSGSGSSSEESHERSYEKPSRYYEPRRYRRYTKYYPYHLNQHERDSRGDAPSYSIEDAMYEIPYTSPDYNRVGKIIYPYLWRTMIGSGYIYAFAAKIVTFDQQEEERNGYEGSGLVANYSMTIGAALSDYSDFASIQGLVQGDPCDKQCWGQGVEQYPWKTAFNVSGQFPFAPYLSRQQMLEKNVKGIINGELLYREEGLETAKVNITADLKRSIEMTQYAKNSSEAERCQQDEKEGYYLTANCANATRQAATFDDYRAEVIYQDVGSFARNLTQQALTLIKVKGYAYLSEDFEVNNRVGRDAFEVQASFSPDGDDVSVTIRTPKTTVRFDELPVTESVEAFLPINIYEDAAPRVTEYAFAGQYAPACQADKDRYTTFDNYTYFYEMNDCYYVFFMDCSTFGNVSILLKENQNDQKDVKILAGVNLVTLSRQQVSVNGQQVTVLPGQMYQYGEIGGEGEKQTWLIVQSYADATLRASSPSGAYGFDLAVSEDGKEVELQVANYYRNVSCGLCSDFNGDPDSELKSSRDCIMHSTDLFAKSYMLKDGTCQAHGDSGSGSSESDEDADDEICVKEDGRQCEAFGGGGGQSRPGKPKPKKNWGGRHSVEEGNSGSYETSTRKGSDEEQECQLTKKYITKAVHGKIYKSIKPQRVCPDHCQPKEGDKKKILLKPENGSASQESGEKIRLEVTIPRRCVQKGPNQKQKLYSFSDNHPKPYY